MAQTFGQFLFHTGSIKSPVEAPQKPPEEGFYSILVRLKVEQFANLQQHLDGFYSILVRLKDYEEPTYQHLTCFYSILVRLKVNRIINQAGFEERFYSILVRLKDPLPVFRQIEYLGFYSILVRLKVGSCVNHEKAGF